jgi:hypothetical protein
MAAIAVVCIAIQLQILQDCACTVHAHTGAPEPFRGAIVERGRVLDVEDGLVEGEEAVVCATFPECGALLVDCEVHDRGEVVYDVEAIFQPNLHVIFCGFLLHPAHVFDGIGAPQVETVVVLLHCVSDSSSDLFRTICSAGAMQAVFSLLTIHNHLRTCQQACQESRYLRVVVEHAPVLSGSIASHPLSAAILMRFAMILRID